MAQPSLTLHCFAGDLHANAIVALSNHLELNLEIRLLKPINLNEKLYKSSLTKTFPMLQIDDQTGTVFVERVHAIFRTLSRLDKKQRLAHLKSPYQDSVNDMLIDDLNYNVLPSVLTSFAVAAGIIEMEKKDYEKVKKDIEDHLLNFS